MAKNGLLGFLKNRSSPEQTTPVKEKTSSSVDFAALFAQPLSMPTNTLADLSKNAQAGMAFYESLNETRLKMALTSFDENMRKAVFETLFLLHVNDPTLANWQFESLKSDGTPEKKSGEPMTADLYMEGVPSGVRGISNLPAMFLEPLQEYVRKTFGMDLDGHGGATPTIINISSGGSIGTIAHKSVASDLDLNVQYDLAPFLFDTSKWNDQTFEKALADEQAFWKTLAQRKQNLPPNYPQQQLAKAYPLLSGHYLQGKLLTRAVLWSDSGKELRTKLINELILLMKRSVELVASSATKKQEAQLKERIGRIQDYINRKFSTTEVYLFPTTNSAFKLGHHVSMTESKESPGSAYELLLNYETILPGIQYTSTAPTHFLFSQALNCQPARYNRFVDYIRFGLLEPYINYKDRLIDLGATPDLNPTYVAEHHGAVYWEAFKASSGNLPKATLNLLRYEMLLDPRFPKTNIQLLKQPDALDSMISPESDKTAGELQAMAEDIAGLPNCVLLKLEAQHPHLKLDPWWLRFKALKIGFGEENGVEGLQLAERQSVSRVIDLAFALHVRISDVFTKPGDTRPFDTQREQILLEFNRQAFPDKTRRRIQIEHMFAGEVHSINQFEQELRTVFRQCLERAQKKIATFNPNMTKPSKEFEVWYHYYQENFEPAPNVIQRAIMNHLKVARGRIQTGYNKKKWLVFPLFAKRIQRGQTL